MFLKNWKLVVRKGQMPGKYLSIMALLECPSCGNSHTIETQGHSIHAAPDDLVNWKIKDICRWRACDKCGIVSGLPAQDEAKLTIELTKTINSQWLKAQDS